MKHTLILVMLVVMHLPAQAKEVIEVIPLKSQRVENIVPVIRPLLNKGSTVTGMRNQLILKVDESELPGIRKVLAEIDKPARRLLIEVSNDGAGNIQGSGVGVDGRIAIGDDSAVEIGNPKGKPGETGANVKVKKYSTRNQFDTSQRIQVMEGYPAFIQAGRMIPVYEPSTQVIGGYRRIDQVNMHYQNATSGFYVIPSLHGDQVTLRIQQHMRKPRTQHPELAVQESNTVVSGKLGEWIQLGGIDDAGTTSGSGISRHTRTRSSSTQAISVRVTALD